MTDVRSPGVAREVNSSCASFTSSTVSAGACVLWVPRFFSGVDIVTGSVSDRVAFGLRLAGYGRRGCASGRRWVGSGLVGLGLLAFTLLQVCSSQFFQQARAVPSLFGSGFGQLVGHAL